MEIREFTVDDLDDVRRFVDLTNAVSEADSPWNHPMTVDECRGSLRHGWDGEPMTPFLALEDGQPVGLAEYYTSEWDNKHLAWLWLAVSPDARRRGHGSTILEAMLDRARGEGRTSVGIDGWESDRTRTFAARHGFAQQSQAVNRRQFLADVDWARAAATRDAAADRAPAYELVRRVGASPEGELEAVAALTAAINDAPTDDLEIEDEVFPAARIRDYETAQLARGYRLHRVVARHRETGELAGHTVVAVDGERPHLAHQHDTAVVRGHRGHGLGLLLKTDMLLWLRETQPEVESIDTWNTESNDHMIAVNEELGYRVMGRALEFQRSLTDR